MLNTLDLGNYLGNICQELFWVVIMQDIHIDTLVAAYDESLAILTCFDASANGRKDESSRVDGFEVSSWHLQYDSVGRGHNSDDAGSTFYTSASFILLWLV